MFWSRFRMSASQNRIWVARWTGNHHSFQKKHTFLGHLGPETCRKVVMAEWYHSAIVFVINLRAFFKGGLLRSTPRKTLFFPLKNREIWQSLQYCNFVMPTSLRMFRHVFIIRNASSRDCEARYSTIIATRLRKKYKHSSIVEIWSRFWADISHTLSGSRFWAGIWNQSFTFHTFSKLFHFYFEKLAGNFWPQWV